MYNRMMKLKSKQPDLKILLALGGWNAGAGNSDVSVIKIKLLKNQWYIPNPIFKNIQELFIRVCKKIALFF